MMGVWRLCCTLALIGCGLDKAAGISKDPKTPPPTSTNSGSPATDGTTATPSAAGRPCACPADYTGEDFYSFNLGSTVLGYSTVAELRPELGIFLHGHAQAPSNHDRLLRTISHAGFRVLAVKYETNPGIDWCADNLPIEDWSWCVEAVRSARVFGSEFDRAIEVRDEDSVVGVIWNQLVAAHEADPAGGWDAYINEMPEGANDHEQYIAWDRVVLAGFSQGASNITMLATHHAVKGVLQISGPGDDGVDWTLDAGATPGCARIGVRHDREDAVAFIDNNLEAMALPGPPTSVDEFELGACEDLPWPPYGGSQHLTTDLLPADGCYSSDRPHGSMANDPCMNTGSAPEADPYALFRVYLGALCMLGESAGCD